jgi:hypothetical protein
LNDLNYLNEVLQLGTGENLTGLLHYSKWVIFTKFYVDAVALIQLVKSGLKTIPLDLFKRLSNWQNLSEKVRAAKR